MSTLDAVARTLTEQFDAAYGALAQLSDGIARLLDSSPSSPQLGPFSQRQVKQLQELAASTMQQVPFSSGAGFVVAADRIVRDDQALQWRVRAGKRTLPYLHVHDVAPTRVYDYTHLSWYAVPAQQHRPGFTGPYFDFLCVDQLALTLSMPVHIANAFAGVAALDIKVSEIEPLLLRATTDFADEVALANLQGQIISATTSRFLPGDRADVAAGLTIGSAEPLMRVIAYRDDPHEHISQVD